MTEQVRYELGHWVRIARETIVDALSIDTNETILYPIIVVRFAFVFMQCYRDKLPGKVVLLRDQHRSEHAAIDVIVIAEVR